MKTDEDFNTLYLAAIVLVAGKVAAGKLDYERYPNLSKEIDRAFNLVANKAADCRKILDEIRKPLKRNI